MANLSSHISQITKLLQKTKLKDMHTTVVAVETKGKRWVDGIQRHPPHITVQHWVAWISGQTSHLFIGQPFSVKKSSITHGFLTCTDYTLLRLYNVKIQLHFIVHAWSKYQHNKLTSYTNTINIFTCSDKSWYPPPGCQAICVQPTH